MVALEHRRTPSLIALSRQACPNLAGTTPEKVRSGAYILASPSSGNTPQLVLCGTGSEVHLLVTAAEKQLTDVACTIVSMPCWELFDNQVALLAFQPSHLAH